VKFYTVKLGLIYLYLEYYFKITIVCTLNHKTSPYWHLVNDNSFKIVDFYLIYSGHKLSGLYTQSQILFQHIARSNDNDNV
jgi:hypothetical protein